jgi:TRAP transporter 4TM/12TM fusion protein
MSKAYSIDELGEARELKDCAAGIGKSPSRGMLDKVAAVIAIVMAIYHILYVSAAFQYVGIYIISVAHNAISLGFMLVLTFLLKPVGGGKKAQTKIPWYDIVFLIASLVGCLYIAVFFAGDISLRAGLGNTYEIVFGVATIVAVLEATRRLVGLPMATVAACFLAYAIFCNYLPGFLHGRGYSFARLINQMYLTGEGMWGVAMTVASTVIICFIIFAQFLNTSGAGEFFTKLALALAGNLRGGPAKVAICASALMGTISGSTSANAATIGVFTIPLMKRSGYTAESAAAIEAVASNGGQIMPPVMGAVAFIICEFLGVSYYQVCIAAMFPAILYFGALFMQVDFEAAKNNLLGLPRSELPSVRRTLAEGWIYLVPIFSLVFLLVVLLYAPERAALFSIVILVALSFTRKETWMGPRKILSALEFGSKSMLLVGLACAAAGIIIGAVSLTGLGVRLSTVALAAAHGNLLILLILCAIASFILGMGMSSIPCYLMLAVTVAPAIMDFGIAPLAAHLFVFYWGLVSFITPPVAVACYVTAGIADANPMRVGLRAVRFGIVIFLLPFVWIYRPAMLLSGAPIEVIEAVAVGILACGALAAGLAGYFLRPASWWQRILFIGSAISLLSPGLTTDVIGLCVLAVPVTAQILTFIKSRRIAAPA